MLRGHNYKAQVHTHVHVHQYADTRTHSTLACTRATCTRMHTHIIVHTRVHSWHTHTHTPRQGHEASWVQSGELITSRSPGLHMPSPAG